jgi:hypothetical protein
MKLQKKRTPVWLIPCELTCAVVSQDDYRDAVQVWVGFRGSSSTSKLSLNILVTKRHRDHPGSCFLISNVTDAYATALPQMLSVHTITLKNSVWGTIYIKPNQTTLTVPGASLTSLGLSSLRTWNPLSSHLFPPLVGLPFCFLFFFFFHFSHFFPLCVLTLSFLFY